MFIAIDEDEADAFNRTAGERSLGRCLELSREGLLVVDRMLPDFFLEEHRGARYA